MKSSPPPPPPPPQRPLYPRKCTKRFRPPRPPPPPPLKSSRIFIPSLTWPPELHTRNLQSDFFHKASSYEIILTKIKIPLSSIANAILAMDSSALNIDQVEDLIRFCPTEKEMEIVKKYSGWKPMIGKSEQLFLELGKVPRVESKLRIFAFTITFTSQVHILILLDSLLSVRSIVDYSVHLSSFGLQLEELKFKLNALNNFAKEIRSCVKLRLILKTLVTLGNPFNRGNTASKMVASSIKLKDIEPSTPERIAFMHHIHTILAEKKPELLEFTKDLPNLGAASKIRLRDVAEDMQRIMKNLSMVKRELTAAKDEGRVSLPFLNVLTGFSDMAEAETSLVLAFFSVVGRNVDALTLYLLDDPARYPFERVVGAFLEITNILARGKSGKVVHSS